MTLYYLATPYSSYPEGYQFAFEEAREAMIKLTLEGYRVFSPVVYNHQLQDFPEFASFKSYDSKRNWLTEDVPYMKAADCLVIYKMPDWSKSIGVSYEKGHFEASGKPVMYMPHKVWETQQVGNWFHG